MFLGLSIPKHWRKPLLSLCLLQVLILVLYWHTALGMASIWWRSDAYAHGMLVPLIGLWLVWRMRYVVMAITPQPGVWGWLVMAVWAIVWWLGDLVSVNAVTQFALVALIVSAVPALLGWKVAETMAFPLLFLFFSVPVGDFMLPQLMTWTANFTVWALRFTGIPVYQEGLQFVIPSGTWSVIEACSGIRYLIAAVMVGCLFSYLSYRTWSKRFIFVLASILVPIVANWMRAYLIVLLGHLSGNKLATGVDHLIYGWVFFGLVMSALFFVGKRWVDVKSEAESLVVHSIPQGARSNHAVLALVFVCAAVVLPQGLMFLLRPSVVEAPLRIKTPAVISPWKASALPPVVWKPSFANASAQLEQWFVDNEGHAVGLYVAYYKNQNYERKLVSSENVLVPSLDPEWLRLTHDIVVIPFGMKDISVESAVVRRREAGMGRFLVWRFYWVHGILTASAYRAKWEGALGRISGWGDDAANIAIFTPLADDGDSMAQAQAVLANYVKTQGGDLLVALAATRGHG